MENMKKYTFIFIIFSFLYSLFYFTSASNTGSIDYQIELEESVLNNQVNKSFPITFYRNAYVDYRFTPPRLRIFALSACIRKTDFLLVDLFYDGIENGTRMKVHGTSLEGSCPSTYGPATPCFYVAHTFFTNISVAGGMNKVRIHLGSRKVNLSVKEIDKAHEPGITVCVQPVYYYSQWQNIVLYIEAWRARGATRFIVFYHSATKDTRMVLEYYQRLGVIELRSWPSFGSLPKEIADKYPKIDDSVFIFSYFLAMNICILDIKTTIGTVADLDEVMVPKNGTLFDYATKEMAGTDVGALSFQNTYIAMNPSIQTNNFSGVASPTFPDKGGPSKYVFNASVIDIAQVHWVKSFIDPKKKSKGADGALLHLRINVQSDKMLKRHFRFFADKSETHIQNMQNTVNTIFNDSVPAFSSSSLGGIKRCVDRINKKGGTCRSTGGLCKADMDMLDKWVYDEASGIFLSGAV